MSDKKWYLCFVLWKSFFSQGFVKKFDTEKMVSKLITNSDVLAQVLVVCQESEHKINKELGVSLLEHLLTLYLRVRSFSYAKDQVQKHKMDTKTVKQSALRNKLQKSSEEN